MVSIGVFQVESALLLKGKLFPPNSNWRKSFSSLPACFDSFFFLLFLSFSSFFSAWVIKKNDRAPFAGDGSGEGPDLLQVLAKAALARFEKGRQRA